MDNNEFSQLEHKRRTVTDLARHLQNRTDNQSNYVLLLGAGASVTSDIRSGKELVTIWKKEIYEGHHQNNNATNEEINLWISTQIQWFDENNEYSSLFEKRFDLPAQRRNFIELEVEKKMPYIGYAYLVKLINSNFINTVMTTNFDDLMNEAFYHYGGNQGTSLSYRPIVCAHDSTINSININSKRPKIIKLHGDYLYDNIKSSLRETESLETNIKNKFIELLKNKGLIIVGYSGADRSIMDTINFLLSNEEYLKHGVYWCVRKGDIPSMSLKKSLWKDRVYFIEIDGFDELMAELNYSINNSTLPIEPSVTMENNNSLINEILQKNISAKECIYIKNDLNKLKQENEVRVITEYVETINNNSVDSRDKIRKSRNAMNTDEEVFLLREKRKLTTNNEEIIKEILENCRNKYENLTTSSREFKIKLLELILLCYEIIEENENALKIIDELIKIEDDPQKYLQNKIELLGDFERKLQECDKIIESNKFTYIPYVMKVLTKIKHYKENGLILSEVEIEEIKNTLDKAIELEPGKHNMAYYIFIDFLLEHNQLKSSEKGQVPSKISTYTPNETKALQLWKDVSKQDPFDNEVITSKISILKHEKKDSKTIEEYIRSNIENKLPSKQREIYSILFNFYIDETMKEEAISLIDEMKRSRSYDESEDIINRYNAEVEFRYYKSLKKALDIYLTLNTNSRIVLKRIAQLYLYNGDYMNAEKIIFEKLEKDFDIKKEFYLRQNKVNILLEELEILFLKNKIGKIEYLKEKIFYLLYLKNYDEIIKICDDEKTFLQTTNENMSIVFNLEYAKKIKGLKVNFNLLEKCRGKDRDEEYEVAYHFLKDDHKKAKEILNSVIKKDYSNKFNYQQWCYFKENPEYDFLYKND